VLNRNKFPKIELEFEIVRTKYELDYDNGFAPPIYSFQTPPTSKREIREHITLNVYARNNGKILANYVYASFVFNNKFLVENIGPQNDDFEEYFGDNTTRDVLDVKYDGYNAIKKYGPSRYDPILPRLRFRIHSLNLNKEILHSSGLIKWEVYADNAEPISGEIELKDIKVIKKRIQ
jgi:hypothetical protein